MKDRKDEQQPPYPDPHNNAYHSGQTDDSRARLSGAISPPPLKRQRTVPDHPRTHVTATNASGVNFSRHTASLPKQQSERDRGADPSWKSYSFPAPPTLSGYKQRQSNVASLNSHVCRSDVSAEAGRSSKRACRVCERSSSTTYNPLTVCGGCTRLYHDSCRKPSLTKGADPQQWRCSACLNGKGVSKGPRVPPALAPTRHSAVRDIFRPNARKSLNLVPSGLSKDVSFANVASVHTPHAHNSNEAVHDKHHFDINESEKIQGLSERPTIELLERTEIASTLTQHTSQTEFPDNTRRGHVQHHVEDSVDPSVVDAHSQPAKHTSLKALCSTCREHEVFMKDRTDTVECSSCRNGSLMAESGKLEISETPDILPICIAQTHAEVTHLAAPISSCIPTTQSAPTSVAHADLVTSRPDAGKTNHDQRSCTTTGSHEALMKPKLRIEVPHIDGAMEPDIVCEADHPKQSSTCVPDRHDGESHEASADTSPLLEDEGSPQLASPSHYKINDLSESLTLTEISRLIELNSSTVDTPEAKQSSATSTEPTGFNDQANQSFTNPEALVNSTLEGMVVSTPKKRYTMRELARIALVGANGTSLTALQVIDWLAQSFSYLQKGAGTWEKNVKSALSGFKEFNSKKTTGSAKLYGFANEEFRAQFEQKYQAYRGRPEPVDHQPVDISQHEQFEPIIQPTHGPEIASKRLKATHTSPLRISVVSRSTKPNVSLIPPSPASIQASPNNDPLRMPFERITTRYPENTYEDISYTKRETNFRAIRSQLQKQSIESMTLDEKARKIAQIQARPSRKKFFGADHRLAHVRRYKRQDIHDERDGAWKPSITNQKRDKRAGDHDIGDIRTLREVFGLPANAIPMNDGQNELAFRDGTLINGRLPRSRHIYRVGKLFGGELTTRLS